MTGKTARHPLIGVPACVKLIDDHPFHAVGEKYLTAVVDGARGVPLVVPALADRQDVADLVARRDGLLVTGSLSNVEPRHYGGPPSAEGTLHDPQRDATTLPLIRAAIEDGLPVLAICRGIQELNVALGGTLHQRVHELPGRLDHRAPTGVPREEKYRPAHPVRLTPGGLLARLAGAEEVMVNSLHAQAIDRPADGLEIEAVAPDGTIEAVRVPAAKAFAVGVQWHPEWRVTENPFYLALFEAFGKACAERAAARRAAAPVGRVA